MAEELHFGRAAVRLRLSPPSSSKQIRQLEVHPGYPLFVRKTRDVQLTAAGCVFVAKARDVLQQTKFALQSAAAASRNEGKDWIVGYSPWIDPTILTKLRDAEGPVRSDIVLTSAYTTIQIEQLLAGRLQVGVVVLPVSATGLEVEVIWRDVLAGC